MACSGKFWFCLYLGYTSRVDLSRKFFLVAGELTASRRSTLAPREVFMQAKHDVSHTQPSAHNSCLTHNFQIKTWTYNSALDGLFCQKRTVRSSEIWGAWNGWVRWIRKGNQCDAEAARNINDCLNTEALPKRKRSWQIKVVSVIHANIFFRTEYWPC